MNDRAQRVLLWVLAVLLVGGTGLALRYARGYRPLAGLGSSPSSNPLADQSAVRFEKFTLSGWDRGARLWTLRAGVVGMTQMQDRTVLSGGVALDKFAAAATAAGRAPEARPGRAWTLTTKRAEVAGVPAQSNFSFSGGDLFVRLFKPDGRTVRATLSSPSASATYSSKWRSLRLSGGTITGAAGDLRVSSSQADWTDTTNQVRCLGPVHVSHSRGDVRGTNLVLNIDSRTLALDNVQGRLRVDQTMNGEGNLPGIGMDAPLNEVFGR